MTDVARALQAGRPGEVVAAARAARRRSRPPWWRVFGYFVLRWRRTFASTLAGNFVYPTLYLAAIGVGLGGLVDRHVAAHGAAAGLGGGTYLAFVAPGILAGSAMTLALHESTYPVMGAIRWERSYAAMLATPLRVVDVLRGHLAFILLRVGLASAVFLSVAGAFGALASPEAALALPAALLTGAAFAGPLVAFSVTRENESSFSTIQRLVVIPLFLFSASFFPLQNLPGFLQAAAEWTPLYHGAALCRAATTGHLWQLDSLGHLAYLVALALAGYGTARVTYRRRLAR